MPHGSQALHHVHKKKRAIEAAAEVEGMSETEVKAAVLNPVNRFKRVLDRMVYFTGALSVFMSIPQVLQIYMNQNAGGVSFATWFAFLINAIIWTTYGLVHKEKAIIMMYCSFIVIDLMVVIGILMYS